MMAELTTCVVLTGAARRRDANENHNGGSQLRRKTMYRSDFVEFAAKRADQPPSAQ